ncbi:DUF5610 domain-containing protein [Psychromonas ossibalaenae]|uniref:DUF5610 domain-containing protein n=1 Tax=Psychromonas ossibalaenae TaxID=444922 RepID=UPI000377E8D3|nr:DUF5610 domain-containing protein [Psychromonas ossibalaenae]
MDPKINTNSAFNQDVRALAKSEHKKESGPMGGQISELAHAKNAEKLQTPISVSNKKQLNAAILQSTLEFSETIADKPLSLVLKTALQGINEALQEMGVETKVEEAYDSGLDVSPEATAERIVSFSTQFFSLYHEQHPEMQEQEALSSFIAVIGGGIDQGFSEARDILQGLNVLEGDIASNIDKTYELVQQGLQSFLDSYAQPQQEAENISE